MADSVKVTNQSEHVEQTVNSSVAAVHTGTNPQSGLSPVHIEPKNKAVVLFSGGVDSTTCLALAIERFGKDNVVPLSIAYGQKHKKELEAAQNILNFYGLEGKSLDVTKLFAFSNSPLLTQSTEAVPEGTYAEQQAGHGEGPVSTYVPFRNGLFLSAAASLALSLDCGYLYYGAHADDAAGNAYPDCTDAFYNAMGTALYEGSGYELKLEAPFIHSNKSDVVREGLRLQVPYELTWSCYEGGERPCGHCGTCIDRIEAFRANGMEDPAL